LFTQKFLQSHAGNDTLNGGAGADTMTGGDGNDYYFVDNLKDFISETNKVVTTRGNDTIESVLLNYTLPANVENLILGGIEISNGTGNKSDNVITGNLADNYLRGDAGNDKLIGNAGVDTLDGGLGMDTLIGGDDSDVYFMNNTEDTIIETENGGDLDQVNATV
jgi:Ca2+-binding RTX toxin-like protein